MNSRRQPLADIATIVQLIAATTHHGGLTVRCTYDPNRYPTGEKIADSQDKSIPLTPHDWHDDWNYTIARSIPR